MFPIKQKCHMRATFSIIKICSSFWSSLKIFLPLCSRTWCANKLHNGLSKKYLVLNIFIIMIDFCLFGNIPHDFLVPRIIESAPKTFMSIQIPDLHRVGHKYKISVRETEALWFLLKLCAYNSQILSI